ncbi:hypothetical protein BC835DRAFT_664375 [Cytidiella melzeri]|nr:hypothetical protein BC835DRAFT_664375 [Cytidiella melzeri]
MTRHRLPLQPSTPRSVCSVRMATIQRCPTCVNNYPHHRAVADILLAAASSKRKSTWHWIYVFSLCGCIIITHLRMAEFSDRQRSRTRPRVCDSPEEITSGESGSLASKLDEHSVLLPFLMPISADQCHAMLANRHCMLCRKTASLVLRWPKCRGPPRAASSWNGRRHP